MYYIADDNGVVYAHDIQSEQAARSTLDDILTAHPEYADMNLEVLNDEDGDYEIN